MTGNHTLPSNLTVTRRTNFLMKSEDSRQPAVINCGASSRLQIHSSAHAHIHGIILNGCVENEVKDVNNLTIEDSIISGMDMINASGRALIITNSTVIIMRSTLTSFSRPRTLKVQLRGHGGAILSVQSDILISDSMFIMNQAGRGGVMYSLGSTVLINNSTFTKNSAVQGGTLYIEQNGSTNITNNHLFQDYLIQWKYNTKFSIKLSRGNVFCIGSNFTLNRAKKGGAIYCKAESSNSTLFVDGSNFAFNNASYGAVFVLKYSNVTIHYSSFQSNKANHTGGVGYCTQSKLQIKRSIFCHNQAEKHAGVLYLHQLSNTTINSSNFYNNSAKKTGGSLHLHRKCDLLLIGIILFEHNSAHYSSAAINIYDSSFTCNGSISITNNSGSIVLVHSTGHFTGYTLFKDNKGPIRFYDSRIVVSGCLTSVKQRSNHALQGGGVSLFLSSLTISGKVRVSDSIATNGGGILSISSRIFVNVRGTLTVTNNTAKDTGGGIYFYHSMLRAQGLVLIQGNRANTFGGGIHSIASSIVLIHNQDGRYIKVANNKAVYGGGICLEASSKFYIQRHRGASKQVVHWIKNSAQHGGAIYVADNTTTGTCASSQVQTVTTSLQTKCFFSNFKANNRKKRLSINWRLFSFCTKPCKCFRS